ncbi:phosphoprotein phosphatase [Moniliophthora roreri]|uniref:Mitochondrial import inner membrane translocase subunit TIM50 n=1 Tax=Moniliophthora roreri TaxID=221103 RepID=A0A0W0FTH0_MONRR|nr:phosphoprotein phosphatase [Moniliophthora roreri]
MYDDDTTYLTTTTFTDILDPYSDTYTSSPPSPSPESQPQNQNHKKRKRKNTLNIISEPSQDYLTASSHPSQHLESPSTQRKLLILDLNGTLCFREPHANPNQTYNMQTHNRPLRITHPRPYMSTFKNYIMNKQTRDWLEVMVWSSAMPGSVRGMVERCFGAGVFPVQGDDGQVKEEEDGKDEFGRDIPRKEVPPEEEEGKLLAMWARDTLGLGQDEYWAKTQTTKDLSKPWKLVSTTQQHSEKTTLLVDDSQLKARLQPYNHLCVAEYDVKFWKWDQEQAGFDSGGVDGEAGGEGEEKNEPPTYDHTLLALIGILDALKNEDNISGWMRAGGLFSLLATATSTSTTNEPVPLSSLYTSSTPELTPSTSPSNRQKKKRWRHHKPSHARSHSHKDVLENTGPLTYSASIGDFNAVPVTANGEVEVPGLTLPLSGSRGGAIPVEGDKGGQGEDTEPEVEAVLNVDVDVGGTQPTVIDVDSTVMAEPEPELQIPQEQWNWYQHPLTRHYWAERGRRACLELGVGVEAGVGVGVVSS